MLKHIPVPVACLGLLLTAILSGCRFDGVDEQSLHSATVALHAESGAPGVALAWITSDRIATELDGVRRADRPEPLLAHDRFHLGSNAKAMLATVIAMTVEDGLLRWDTRVTDVLPEVVPTMQATFRPVELQDLLAHRAGLIAVTELEDILAVPEFGGSPVDQRVEFAVWAFAQPAPVDYGTSLYSNADHAIAAAMLERVTGERWDALMERRLFRPLGIDARFAWPAAGAARQPWGHTLIDGRALPNDPDAIENSFPEFLKPVAHVSMSVRDYARFVQLHLRALRGMPRLLRADSFIELHRARGDYALGWGFGTLNGVRAEAHQGSAGTFDALVVMQPDRNRAVIALANAGDDEDRVTGAMVQAAARLVTLADQEAP